MKKTLSLILCVLLMLSAGACKSRATENMTEPPAVASPETAAPETETVPAETETAAELKVESAEVNEPDPVSPEIEEVIEIPRHIGLLLTRVCETAQGEENRVIYTAEYPAAHVNETDGDLYPALSATLAEDEKSLQELIETSKVEMSGNAADYQDDPYFDGMHHEIRGTVLRSDTAAVSVKHDFSGYFGGAHGDYSMTAYNYDAKTGKRLSIADVVTDPEVLQQILAEKLTEIPEVVFLEEPAAALAGYDYTAEHEDPEKPVLNFAVGNEALTVWFNPYELTAYAFGIQEIVLPYAEYPELFIPAYTTAADSFFEPVDADVIRKTGEKEISFSYEYNEYGVIGDLAVTINGEEEKLSVSTYHPEAYLVKASGKYYLYVFEDGDDDVSVLDIIDLNGEKAVRTDRFPARLYVEYDRYDINDSTEDVHASGTRNTVYSLTDPEAFLLSTGDGVNEYHVGENGIPEKN